MRGYKSQVVPPGAGEDRRHRRRDKVMELVNVEPEIWPFGLADLLAAHDHLMELRDNKCTKQVSILFADQPLGELHKKDFLFVQYIGEINPILILRDHVADDLWPQKRVEAGENRCLDRKSV